MASYYNEINPLKAEVLRVAIAARAIAKGDVDERSIADVQPSDLVGYTQCHFFAGGGFWSLALRQAGWPDDRRVWTGSCPCQSFSNAGSRRGKADPRHLWPSWVQLIRACKPPVVFGEQVGAAAGGKSYPPQGMQGLQNREAVRRVLYELERQSPRYLQILHAGSGETPEERPQERDFGKPLSVEKQAARICISQRGEVSSEAERVTLRPRSAEHSGTDRPWSLRSDGDFLRPEHTEIMERSLFGSDFELGGLHDGEHPSSALFLECDGERLGRTEGGRSRKRGIRAAYKAERRTARILDRCFEETPEWSWLDSVRGDMERAGYACGTSILGAHSVGAPHIRQRLYFVANTPGCGHDGRRPSGAGLDEEASEWGGGEFQPQRHRDACLGSDADGGNPSDGHVQRGGEQRLLAQDRAAGDGADTEHDGRDRPSERTEAVSDRDQPKFGILDGNDCTLDGSHAAQRGLAMRGSAPGSAGHAPLADATCGGDDAILPRLEGHAGHEREWRGPGWLTPEAARSIAETGATRGFWSDCDWWYGRDGKYRPIEPGLFPLAHGSAARVGRLRLYGDAIAVPVAQAFIEAYLEARSSDLAAD